MKCLPNFTQVGRHLAEWLPTNPFSTRNGRSLTSGHAIGQPISLKKTTEYLIGAEGLQLRILR